MPSVFIRPPPINLLNLDPDVENPGRAADCGGRLVHVQLLSALCVLVLVFVVYRQRQRDALKTT